MFNCAKAVLLGALQGLTEFLPVSSSGHLVLAKRVMGLQTPGATLEVALHTGTLLSVLLYYRGRIAGLLAGIMHGDRAARSYGAVLLVASAPILLVGGCFHRAFESLFDDALLASTMLLLTGFVLLSLRSVQSAGTDSLCMRRGVWVGFAQVIAILPGISRSGVTVTVARHLGMEPRHAAEFSLLLSVPALLGAIAMTVLGANGLGGLSPCALLAGTVVAAAVGFAAICLLVRTLVSGRFWLFGFYCLALGLLDLVTGS